MTKALYNLKLCKYILIIGSIILTLLHISTSLYPVFIFLSLLIFINSQLRVILLKNQLFIVSLLFEILLILYLQSFTDGYVYLIFFSTLIDSVMDLKNGRNLMFFLITSVLIYTLYAMYSFSWVSVILLSFITAFLLLRQLKEELNAKMDTEVLYDQIRKSNYELEAAKARLLSYSKQVEKMSQLEERNRISRELHDSIGHDLTGILMQVDASMQIIPLDQEKGLDILSSAYNNINNSIEGVRQTVRKLRPTTFETYMTSLEDLIVRFQNNTGVIVKLLTTGVPYQLYPSIEITLYKNTREALTNSIRHGHAKTIQIHIIYNSDNLQLIITDDGIGSASIVKGFGLSGMEERINLVGGTISFSGTNGFSINMQIPIREVE